MFNLLLRTVVLRTHRLSPMTIVMIIDRKCRDQVTDQELVAHNVTKHVTVAPTVLSLTSDHHISLTLT